MSDSTKGQLFPLPPKPASYRRVRWNRARSDTKKFVLARSVWGIAVAVGVGVMSIPIQHYRGVPIDMAAGLTGILVALAAIGFACVVCLLWHWCTAPALIYQDDQKQIAELKSQLQIREDRQPDIVYDHIDEASVKHKNGVSYKYVHLWFRNRPTGRSAHDVAARITMWSTDGAAKKLFSAEGKWTGVDHELGRGIHQVNIVNLLPNDASHGLDFVIKGEGKPGFYAFVADSPYRGFQRKKYLVPPGPSCLKVTLACERYTQDFWFSVWNDEGTGSITVEHGTAESLSPE